MLVRASYKTREEWLKGRNHGIGASEAAAMIGQSAFMSNVELWRLKTGLDAPKDMTGNPAIDFGNRAEPALRALYQAMHPDVQVEYHPFDILRQEGGNDFITATLDGEIHEKNGRTGVLEIKTARLFSRRAWDEWSDGKMKQTYFCQCLWQLLATGWAYVDLFALLVDRKGEGTLRTYRVDRKDHEEDLQYLAERGRDFWQCVKERREPPTILPSL